MSNIDHMDYLTRVVERDVAFLQDRERTYKGSWKASGGRSAWFMLKRKIDRLLTFMARPPMPDGFSLADLDQAIPAEDWEDCTVAGVIVKYLRDAYVSEDIFLKIEEDPSGADGTVLAEIRDLRRYLVLVEAEILARQSGPLKKSDYEAKVDPNGVVQEWGGPLEIITHPSNVDMFTGQIHVDNSVLSDPPESLYSINIDQYLGLEYDDQKAYTRYSAVDYRLHQILKEEDFSNLSPDLKGYYFKVIGQEGHVFCVLDRSLLLRNELNGLSRYPIQQNKKELENLPEAIQLLYSPDNNGTYTMRPEYQTNWGK